MVSARFSRAEAAQAAGMSRSAFVRQAALSSAAGKGALGSSYSRTLRVVEGEDQQAVVDAGPYRLIRHPGYLGSLLTWVGFALTSRRLPVVALIVGLLGAAYARRIAAKEQLLRRDLPGYPNYSERTEKLIPFVW